MKSTVDRRRFSLIIIAALIVAISVFNFYFNRILYNSYNCNFHSTRESDVKQSMESSKCMELFVHEASYDKWGQKPKRFLMEIWNRALQLPQSISASIGPWKVFHMTPQTYHCKPDDLIRIGDDGDGGKLVCTEYFPKNKPGCLVVSLGSRGDFSFEKSILQYSSDNCVLHTFDCTGEWPVPHPNIKFHKWCLGSNDTLVNGMQFKTWSTILRELQIERVDLLKMDIEGYEWSTLPFMLQDPETNKLPKQILLELHMFPYRHVKDTFGGQYFPPGTPAEMMPVNANFLQPVIRLFQQIYYRGYEVANFEYNPESIEECCQEYTFIRV